MFKFENQRVLILNASDILTGKTSPDFFDYVSAIKAGKVIPTEEVRTSDLVVFIHNRLSFVVKSRHFS